MALEASQWVVGLDPTKLVKSSDGPRVVVILNGGSNGVYIGPKSDVSASNGFLLPIGVSITLELDSTERLWACSSGGATSLVYLLVY